MPITGGIKFFEPNKNLFQDGATGTATSGESLINRALDKNPLTKWRSTGSNDLTTETLTITLSEASTIDRILLVDHNWKEFTVKYDSGGGFTDFTTVVGIDGALGGGIAETAFADDVAYYEFDSVTGVTDIQITVTKTQVADEEKFISQIVTTEELGTFQGFPRISNLTRTRNERAKRVLSGRSIIQKSVETTRFTINFRDYPPSGNFSADLDVGFTLFDREDNFLVWPSGGKRGTSSFKYTLRNFRLIDLLEMQVSRNISMGYRSNVYVNPVNLRVPLVEAV